MSVMSSTVLRLLLEPSKSAATHNVQSYLPAYPRRELSDQEKLDILLAQKDPLPRVFPSLGDPITADMSSPGWASAMAALLGSVPGAFGGAYLGQALGGGKAGPIAGSALGALASGGLAGLLGYQAVKARNKDLEEYMRRNPEGATRRDMYADSYYNAEKYRQALRQSGSDAGLGALFGYGFGKSAAALSDAARDRLEVLRDLQRDLSDAADRRGLK